jgi:hypothetical protein
MLAVLLPELPHVDRGRDVRASVHELEGIDRVNARKRSVQRRFNTGGRATSSVEDLSNKWHRGRLSDGFLP